MLVRKRKNRSGSITVVVVDKSSGKFRERANFGSSSNPEEINRLVDKARDYILRYDGQQLLDFEGTSKAIEATEAFIGGIESELLNGPQLRIQGHHTTRPATSSSCKTRHVIILQDPPRHHPTRPAPSSSVDSVPTLAIGWQACLHQKLLHDIITCPAPLLKAPLGRQKLITCHCNG